MPSTWQPDRSQPNSMKAAAFAAANASSRPNKRSSLPNSGWGNSAANQALSAAGTATDRVEPREPMTDLNRQKSLRAAKGAFAGSTVRPRSRSSPQTYPDSANAATNALSAATAAANRSDIYLKIEDVGAVPVTTMNRQMYTANPPVKPEVDERNREASLHASAVAMAKTMYAQQQKMFDATKQAQGQNGIKGSSAPGSPMLEGNQQPRQYTNLQEAAYKLAQERLARLRTQHEQDRELAEYYGTSPISPDTPSRKLSKIGRMRRRSSSDGDVTAHQVDDDRQRSRQIHKQMSMFSTRLDEVDEAKRSRDREALLAAAQRNVKAALEGMDEKRYRDTGRVPSSKLDDWEAKAYSAAQSRSDARTSADKTGKVDLGAGQYMDREKVEEIAAKRVQPVLDEINEKAELERQRIIAQKEEQEKKRLEWEAEKARNAEIKESARKLKEEEKARVEGLKLEAKAQKNEEKAARAEEKRAAKEKGQTSIEDPEDVHQGVGTRQSLDKTSGDEVPSTPHHRSRLSRPFTPKIQTRGTAKNDASVSSPVTSPDSAGESQAARVKNWLRSRLSKPRSRSISSGKAEKQPAGGFIGGVALSRLHTDGTGSLTSLSDGTRSMREVALAGRPLTAAPPSTVTTTIQAGGDEVGESSRTAQTTSSPPTRERRGFGRSLRRRRRRADSESSSLSSVSSEGDAKGEVARARARARTAATLEGIEAPKTIEDPAGAHVRLSGSPERGSKFIENIE
ncbi:hypothetical protein BD289DRAFT_442828 [Coniella lustricola]|uniref:Eisosome protein 1 n=1 Tax=Coniella lustricola TaxID=2025994 RepID=A0A2T2ZXT2_9PEZI|nr:hypothetical protein BD289DRAFT_442828 [Coniella lustricola]